jgi:phage/conjugal plasmid C-4 type zinc finger TraR family protein
MDVIDRAQQHEENHRAAALANRVRSLESQIVDGKGRVLCVDCRDPIPKKRLQIAPRPVRCIQCQTDYERRRGAG